MNESKPVLYLLNRDDEADDVRFFCSTKCRADYALKQAPLLSFSTAEGESSSWIAGAQCETCGEQL